MGAVRHIYEYILRRDSSQSLWLWLQLTIFFTFVLHARTMHTHSHNNRFFLTRCKSKKWKKILLLLSTPCVVCFTRKKYWDQRMGKTTANRMRSLFAYRSTTPDSWYGCYLRKFLHTSPISQLFTNFHIETEAKNKRF